jgi:uncharacterized membrane protein YsdA (DUF1294 family)
MDLPFPPAPLVIYAGLNILAFAGYAHDKLKAKIGMDRSSERVLLFVAAVGPFGALAAMMAFRHKIRHRKFFLVPVFALLHAALIVWLWP